MIGVIITARVGSSRLPRKHLLPAAGRPMIWWLCARMQREFQEELEGGRLKLVIATSNAPGNEVFRGAIQDLNADVFFGDDGKIPLRHLQCAVHYGLDYVIPVDGDDILASRRAARTLANAMGTAGENDWFETNGLPLGMNVTGCSSAYLKKCVERASDARIETGWGRIFVNPRKVKYRLGNHEIHGDLRFTLDYAEDGAFFKAIIEELKDGVLDIGDEELIALVLKREYHKLNTHLKEAYWAHFEGEKAKEQSS